MSKHTNNITLNVYISQVMSNQPEVENVVKRFVWAQYDRHSKRLYYVYSEVNCSLPDLHVFESRSCHNL